MTLEASATFIEVAKKVPAVITDLYKSSTFFPTSGVDPEVTLSIFSTVCFLSPIMVLV